MTSQLIKEAWGFCPEADLAHCTFESNFCFRVLQHDILILLKTGNASSLLIGCKFCGDIPAACFRTKIYESGT